MKRTTSLLAIAAAFAMTAGCRSRQAADIPPEALGTTPGEQSENQDGNVTGAAVPPDADTRHIGPPDPPPQLPSTMSP